MKSDSKGRNNISSIHNIKSEWIELYSPADTWSSLNADLLFWQVGTCGLGRRNYPYCCYYQQWPVKGSPPISTRSAKAFFLHPNDDNKVNWAFLPNPTPHEWQWTMHSSQLPGLPKASPPLSTLGKAQGPVVTAGGTKSCSRFHHLLYTKQWQQQHMEATMIPEWLLASSAAMFGVEVSSGTLHCALGPQAAPRGLCQGSLVQSSNCHAPPWQMDLGWLLEYFVAVEKSVDSPDICCCGGWTRTCSKHSPLPTQARVWPPSAISVLSIHEQTMLFFTLGAI